LTFVDVSTIIDVSTLVDATRRYDVSRVQLALNVANIDEAIAFYSKLFNTEPAKVRGGYANFAVVDPPLKLVLIEDATQTPGTLNHLGVEVETTQEVTAAQTRLSAADLATAVEDNTSCCYAVQDKVWVDGPGGEPWEIYTVLADTEHPDGQLRSAAPGEANCCATRPDVAVAGPSCC
jgi:catechol 2,3-dioxygenase-like lactoylglutathione lyase family enzyme